MERGGRSLGPRPFHPSLSRRSYPASLQARGGGRCGSGGARVPSGGKQAAFRLLGVGLVLSMLSGTLGRRAEGTAGVWLVVPFSDYGARCPCHPSVPSALSGSS